MKSAAVRLDGRVEKWWASFGTALFLLIPVDLLTTLLAVDRYGLAVESNPVVRWLFQRGIVEVVIANLTVAVTAVILFHYTVASVRPSVESSPRALAFGIDVWVGLALVIGVVIVANNLLVLI